MTPREVVEKVLFGGRTERVPFTIYECMIPQCAAERALRNRGMCIVDRRDVFKSHCPNVKITEHTYWEGERRLTRTFYETPVGTLSSLKEWADFTFWTHEPLFKTPDDYKALLFLIKDETYEPAYAEFARAEKDAGGDIIFRARFGLEPLQDLISGGKFNTESFSLEWMTNRDEVLKLYEANVENRRKVYSIVADSPASHANYGGNVVPEVIGLETFDRYYVQHYNEAAEAMHKRGKRIGCHFDANCRLLAKAIADTGLDYIEAFTPAPDTDMSLGEAREAWPDKVLWLNYPSSLHLANDEVVEQRTVDMLNELESAQGVIMGITENIPEERWRDSLTAIMNGLERHARDSVNKY